MTQNHHARDHATWSASSTERNWNCPGALALGQSVAHLEKESEAAAWGTACHQVAEKCLRGGQDAIEYVGRIEKTKSHELEVDEEMAGTAQMYIDYVRGREEEYLIATGNREAAGVMIEAKFSLAKISPPFDAGGTGDAVIWFPKWGVLEVVDLKGGRGVVVEVDGNKQLRTYGLGAMLAFPHYKVARVRVTIVQPRAYHKDGRIRSEEFSPVDLMEWTSDLVDAMNNAATAMVYYKAITGVITREAWAANYLAAGPHCKFCPASGICPALEKKAYDAAGVWFDDLGTPASSNTPDAMSVERLAQALDVVDVVEEWVGSVRKLAHAAAEGGITIPNYILVQKQGREKWTEEGEATARDLLSDVDEKLWLNEPKLRTPKQVREAVKKAKLDINLDGLSVVSSSGTNLVREDKTSRPAVPSKADRFFDVLG